MKFKLLFYNIISLNPMIFNIFGGSKETTSEPQEKKTTLLQRFANSLGKTRQKLNQTLNQLFLRDAIDTAFLDQLYDALIIADCGPDTSEYIITTVKERYFQAAKKPENLQVFVQDILVEILQKHEYRPYSPSEKNEVITIVGVNGVGKTTTIGRLAHLLQTAGHSVALAAGDTFRAAACEQLQEWGTRNRISVISQNTGADSASVIFDAYQHTIAQNTRILLADTAGRLHNKDHLMAELAKIHRVLGKLNSKAPHQTWLVIDATVGQNGLKQAESFHKHLQLTGVILTKLDGTAKGGIVFAITHQLQLPILYVGLGEGLNDLCEFDAKSFVQGLIETD